MTIKNTILSVFYVATGAVGVFLFVKGRNYFFMPRVERPHHPLHVMLEPKGFWGHGLGIIGSAMMLLLLFYLARKYFRFMRRWGNIGDWLDIHIWLGITGPVLVTFHTAFKFGGIVSISFWSMVAVAASGVFGRYIYLQIPRRISGEELTTEELQEMDRTLAEQIQNLPGVVEPLLSRIQSLAKFSGNSTSARTPGMVYWLMDSLRMRLQLLSLRRALHAQTKLNRYMVSALIRSIKERRLFDRRLAFLKAARRILHHWHLVHRPFALVMYVIMVIHVLVTALMGYTWIFGHQV